MRQAAKQGHPGMGMRVDQSGYDNVMVIRIACVPCIALRCLGTGDDVQDAPVVNSDAEVGQRTGIAVHGNDMLSVDQGMYMFHRAPGS